MQIVAARFQQHGRGSHVLDNAVVDFVADQLPVTFDQGQRAGEHIALGSQASQASLQPLDLVGLTNSTGVDLASLSYAGFDSVGLGHGWKSPLGGRRPRQIRRGLGGCPPKLNIAIKQVFQHLLAAAGVGGGFAFRQNIRL